MKNSQPMTTAQNKTLKTVLPPATYFDQYSYNLPFPTIPSSLSTYTIKTNYTLSEVLTFSKKVGLSEYKQDTDKKYVTLYNFSNPANMGIMTFNTLTGSFTFRSYGDHTLPEIAGSTNQKVYIYLTTLGVADPSVSCPISYKRKGEPYTNVTFYECHRDWSKTGAAILNPIGVLNIPENRSLSSLQLGQVDADGPDDETVFALSTGQNGKARPNEFNTVTVAVENDTRILSIDSNLRQVSEAKIITQNDLLSPSEALTKLREHQSALSLTIPAGSGSLSWSTVYPNNYAYSKQAEITDLVLAYIEKPSDQMQYLLVPMYVARGKTTLDSGYTVRFLELLPALKNGSSIFAHEQKTVAGAQTKVLAQNASDSLQLLPYYPTGTLLPTPTLAESGEIEFPTPTPRREAYRCTPPGMNEADQEVTLEVPGLGNMVVRVNPYGSANKFYYISSDFGAASLNEVKTAFWRVVGEQYIEIMGSRLHTAAVNANSVQDMYGVFSSLGSSKCELSHTAPPIPGCTTGQNFRSGTYESTVKQETVKYVADYAANKILQAKRNNTLASVATGKSYFPYNTIQKMGYTFIEYTDWSQQQQSNANDDFSCYITGVSPSLFLYSSNNLDLSVTLPSPTTYTYPSAENNSWYISINGDRLMTQDLGLMTNYLYYEYDKQKVSFTASDTGFIVKKANWEPFVKETIAKKLGLAAAETDRLVIDVRNTISSLSDLRNVGYLRISLANQEELHEKLPLTFSVTPDTLHRIHLLITPLSSPISLISPTLTPLSRSGFTVIEIGARTLH